MELISDDDLDKISESDKGKIKKSVGQMSEDEVKKIIEQTKIKGGFENLTQALIAVSGLCQLGATNKGSSRSITYTYKNKTISAGDFANICSSVKAGGTPRQFARAAGTSIAKIAKHLHEPDDLSRQMKLDHPNLTPDEECWCSNFQSSNPDCPDLVRNWLREDFRKRFNE
jgi:hypothetical protein